VLVNKEEIAAVEQATEQPEIVLELSQLQLLLVGGGIGDTIL
jgi:hypothetical protein